MRTETESLLPKLIPSALHNHLAQVCSPQHRSHHNITFDCSRLLQVLSLKNHLLSGLFSFSLSFFQRSRLFSIKYPSVSFCVNCFNLWLPWFSFFTCQIVISQRCCEFSSRSPHKANIAIKQVTQSFQFSSTCKSRHST